MPGEADGFVVDAFHQAAVASDHPGAVIDQIVAIQRIEVTLGNRHADRGRQALAQRAGRRFDACELEILGMSGAGAVELAEIANVVDRRPRIAREVKRRIGEHRTMARRQDESVAVGPTRVGRIKFQIVRIKDRRDIGHAHGHPRMTAVCGLDGVHRKCADSVGELTFGLCHYSPGMAG